MPSSKPVPDLTAHLGYWLRYVSNHVSQAFARRVEANGVTVAEWVLMRRLLDEKKISPSRLADGIGMTRGAITKLADRLIAKSLVERVAHPEDGRAQMLSLTAAGRALVPKLAALADANEAEFFDHLSDKDRAALLRIFRGIVRKHGLKSLPVD
ncbi:MAG: MarR family winged helix-turn-helix transcriptional regulator [Rhodanobacteraceae bacterium]